MVDTTTTRALELAQYTLGTRDRPLGLTLACPDGVRDDILLPQRMIGNETICGGFEHRILCVTDDAELVTIVSSEALAECIAQRLRATRSGLEVASIPVVVGDMVWLGVE